MSAKKGGLLKSHLGRGAVVTSVLGPLLGLVGVLLIVLLGFEVEEEDEAYEDDLSGVYAGIACLVCGGILFLVALGLWTYYAYQRRHDILNKIPSIPDVHFQQQTYPQQPMNQQGSQSASQNQPAQLNYQQHQSQPQPPFLPQQHPSPSQQPSAFHPQHHHPHPQQPYVQPTLPQPPQIHPAFPHTPSPHPQPPTYPHPPHSHPALPHLQPPTYPHPPHPHPALSSTYPYPANQPPPPHPMPLIPPPQGRHLHPPPPYLPSSAASNMGGHLYAQATDLHMGKGAPSYAASPSPGPLPPLPSAPPAVYEEIPAKY